MYVDEGRKYTNLKKASLKKVDSMIKKHPNVPKEVWEELVKDEYRLMNCGLSTRKNCSVEDMKRWKRIVGTREALNGVAYKKSPVDGE